ncbi:MAG: von Willebrand factor type A domain-containing protein, partial [Alphaproteobacteria bacterium]|nr:von Willebrand factor type A domain-containing protein [Alphaproteobacteria bacterium]
DTASYAFTRASLNRGVLPQPDAVRVEELINYFPYDYAPPESRARPFATHVSLLPTPWNSATRLLHIGIKGYALTPAIRPPANLVFLVDTSGSMDAPDKLPLLINSLRLLLDTLKPEDTVAVVAYAGAVGTVLEPTPAAERGAIAAALEALRAGGSTAGAEGIRQAYLLAEQNFVEGGVNRVILATDGDFNVGITDPDELEGYIARKRASGIFLSVLGFGMGNYNDALMQRLAQNGNGNAAYIDTLSEARKVLVEEATSTLFPIAKDVKIQVEFNPALVSEYRLIGYETRMLAREDFRNDKVDAGEIGAGHTVTALYEITPVGSGAERIAPLRYGQNEEAESGGRDDELATVAIRYKLPDAETSTEIARHMTGSDAVASPDGAPEEVRFAAAVAAFGQLLRGGRYTEGYGYDDVIALAQAARGEDPFGYRAEFLSLVRLAKTAAAMEPLRR